MMINKSDMKFFKTIEDSDIKVDVHPKQVIFDSITEIMFTFKHYKSVSTTAKIDDLKVDLNGEVYLKCMFNPTLYNRLGEGSIVDKMIVRGWAVDPTDCEVLDFEVTYDCLENTNVIVDFNTECNYMIATFVNSER